ncbi:hypothetical protein ACLOJK_022388 [Asimina triloba]
MESIPSCVQRRLSPAADQQRSSGGLAIKWQRPQPKSSCIFTRIEQIKSDSNIRDAGSHESSRASMHSVVEQKPTSSFPSKQKLIQQGMVELNAANRQASRRDPHHDQRPLAEIRGRQLSREQVAMQIRRTANQRQDLPSYFLHLIFVQQ